MSGTQKGKMPSKAGKPKATPNASDRPIHPLQHSSLLLGPTPPSPMAPPLQSAPTPQVSAPKVAIPRLRRDSDAQSYSATSAAGDKNRVSHACEPCRHRKTKCSGERPACKHCEDFKLVCNYADGKRDRTKKQMGSMAGKLGEYEQLLRELSLRADGDTQERIAKALEREASPVDDEGLSIVSPKKSARQGSAVGDPLGPYGEHNVSARVGSTESLDKIDEDFNRDATARATGFHGKNSEVTWMQRLKRQTTYDLDDGPSGNSKKPPSFSEEHHSTLSHGDFFGSGLTLIAESTYHCDDMPVLMAEQVDAFELPPRNVANALFQSYLDTVHPAFPIIGKSTFLQQFQGFFDDRETPNHNWLAILNMIFAIGAKYSHLIKAEWRGDERDHLIYFTRSRMLGLNADSVMGQAELQKVQITGLMAFYLMAINQINRSWALSGMALRHAMTLGLNLRNDSKEMQDGSKEIRYRVWWALCSTERMLAVMTGRPTSFAESDCTAPLPLPVDEQALFGDTPPATQALKLIRRKSSESSRPNDTAVSTPSSSRSYKKKTSPAESQSSASPQKREPNTPPSHALFFLHITELGIFTAKVLSRIYRASAMEQSWAEVQAVMSDLDTTLEKWRQELPALFDFTKQTRDRQWVPQRMSLGFFYYSTKAIINRPCLCRIDRKIPHESGKARNFNRVAAAKCVHAASDMLDLLPDEPNPVGLYAVCPWWCLVHHLVQAAAVLMMELSFRADHMPDEVDDVFASAKKAVLWLRSMSDEDMAASRAWSMCDDMLRKVAPKVGKTFLADTADGMDGIDGSNFTQAEDMAPVQYPFSSSSAFKPQMFTSYDQFLSNDILPTTSAPAPNVFNNMFPGQEDMDAMNFVDSGASGYFPADNQHWYPGMGS